MVKKALVLGFVFAVLGAACGLNTNTEQATTQCVDAILQNPGDIAPTGSGGQNAQGGTGGEGGTGGAAVAPECAADTVAKDCAHLSAPHPHCGSVQCIENKCVLDIKPGPVESQKYGDCKEWVCDVQGNLIELINGGDIFNDGNQCTLDYCDNDQPKSEVFPDGWGCPEAGEGYCYQGKCVECVDIIPQANCKGAGMVCDQLFCEPFGPDCMAQCGGNCAPCWAGQACVVADDCQSGVCTNGMCQLPTCSDGVKNDGETGLDCGAGSCENPCADGEGCITQDDCQSGVCKVGICQAPSCTDATENGDETGIDCGGTNCKACVEF